MQGIVKSRRVLSLAAFCLCTLSPGFAQIAPNRYALILEDPPVSSRISSRQELQSASARTQGQQIAARQQTLRTSLASRKIQVTGSADTLLNAVFVVAPKDRVPELSALSGVKAVVPLRRYRMKLNRATQLVNAPNAWSALGGIANAGKGIKIAILDSGIDQNHPAFQDSSLSMPSGYPLCTTGDCAYTNSKVIVARSYVRQLAAGSASNPAADSRPDDYSARDHDGHGTAVASVAAGNTATGVVTINGIAPKAYLGNYKIYGSPEVNDFTTDDVIIQALEDAMKDGMDVISFSSGGPAFTGPLDSGAACDNPEGVPCDLTAQAFETAARSGVVIVAAAGNEGQDGSAYPTYNSISSPADAPSVIAAGASTNSHFFMPAVTVSGDGVPANLQSIAAEAGDAYIPIGAVSAPLRDVTQYGDDGLACSPLPAGSLSGAFALIQRGTCTFAAKMNNAVNAGAAGVVFYMADSSSLISPGGLASFYVPAVLISNADGVALKTFIDANPDHSVSIDAAGLEQEASDYNQLAGFSSRGPATGTYGLKPDLLAVGTSMYMAVENLDPLGVLYSSNGYSAADGTSFSTPLVAGAAALVKQSHPTYTPAQIRSALINTATNDVTKDNYSTRTVLDARSTGAGKLDTAAAIQATVASDPATISFGALTAATSLPKTQTLQLTNAGGGPVTLTAAVSPAGGAVAIDKTTITLAAGASDTLAVTLSGSVPAAGSYSGFITLQGTGVSLRIPYLYMVGDGSAADLIPLSGDNFDGTVGQTIPDGVIAFKLVDQYGIPIAGTPVTFTTRGGGTLQNADTVTDAYGVAQAQAILGSQPGTYVFTAVAGGMRYAFSGTARPQPAISDGGIVNGASFDAPVAPGSYISIFGSGLSDTTDNTTTAELPLAIDYVNVSFDVPSANLSLPGRLVYVSPNQVNVQVPWELQGQSSAQVKVTIDYSPGNVINVTLSDYAPALFENGGVAAALDAQNAVIGSSNPARRGQIIQLYANGLGPVTNQPASGSVAPASPLAQTTTLPVVTIGGQQATVAFSGLAPGYAGLYQINVTVPESLSAGTQPVAISMGGKTSKQSAIPVQ